MGQSSSSAFDGKARRPPKLLANTLTRKLADIELQLVMQHLDAKDLLRFARCSRRLMQAADSAFAWRSAAVRVDSIDPNVSTLSSSRLLRHSFISLRLAAAPTSPEAFDSLLALPIWSRVRELHVMHDDGIHSAPFTRLLAAHLIALRQSLEVIEEHGSLFFAANEGASCLSPLASLPLLHTLITRARTDDQHDGLADAPALTCLAVTDWVSHLPAVAKCTKLAHLSVTFPKLGGSMFLAFCTSPHISANLQTLSFDLWMPTGDAMSFLEPISAEDLAAGFAALHVLHSLCLSKLPDYDSTQLLSHLVHAPALTNLVLTSLPSSNTDLQNLLLAAPRLHFTLLLSPGETKSPELRKFFSATPQLAGRVHARLDQGERPWQLLPMMAEEQKTRDAKAQKAAARA